MVMTVAGDFDSIMSAADVPSNVSGKRKAEGQGQRENLRVYETMPAQLLNAYGAAGSARMEKERVWEELNKPSKTGAKYMTGPCKERRGVGISRFGEDLVEYRKIKASAASMPSTSEMTRT